MRPVMLADAALILALMNDPTFVRYVADRGLRTPEDAANYIAEKMLPGLEKFGFGIFVVERKEAGIPIGTCGLLHRDFMADVDIGWAFLPEFRGQGYAFEAATAVLAYGRQELGLKRIVAMTSPEHERSIHLIEKLGLRFERMIEISGSERPAKLFG
ncbi:MAG: GNAT family N-acetyltransferase [Chthoniobacterales bacterium]